MTHRIISRITPVVAVAAATAVVLAPAASAHDQLISTNPASGSHLATAPKDLSLTFNTTPLTVGNQIVVRGPGDPAAPVVPKLSGRTLSIPFTAHGNGAYQVTWRVVSSDGHPISGSFGFTLEGEKTSASTPGGEAPPASSSHSVSSGQRPVASTTPATAEPTSGAKASGGWALAILGAVGLVVLGVFVLRRRGSGR